MNIVLKNVGSAAILPNSHSWFFLLLLLVPVFSSAKWDNNSTGLTGSLYGLNVLIYVKLLTHCLGYDKLSITNNC